VSEPQSPSTTLVVLGASNVRAGLRDIAVLACSAVNGPLELHAAAGNGRSYGQVSRFLGRVLPSIADCGLWQALALSRPARCLALLTDLGNDLAFGASAQAVQGWLEGSLDRLARWRAQIVVTGLPLDSVERMSPREFEIWSRILFPWHRIERAHVLAQARELDARLAELARRRGLIKVDPRPEWYGRDPIHVRRDCRRRAWASYLAPLGLASPRVEPADVRGRLWYERVRLFGVECGTAQPCARFRRAGSLHLY
jgi:hypothetical protein